MGNHESIQSEVSYKGIPRGELVDQALMLVQEDSIRNTKLYRDMMVLTLSELIPHLDVDGLDILIYRIHTVKKAVVMASELKTAPRDIYTSGGRRGTATLAATHPC